MAVALALTLKDRDLDTSGLVNITDTPPPTVVALPSGDLT